MPANYSSKQVKEIRQKVITGQKMIDPNKNPPPEDGRDFLAYLGDHFEVICWSKVGSDGPNFYHIDRSRKRCKWLPVLAPIREWTALNYLEITVGEKGF